MFQSKSGTSLDLSNSGDLVARAVRVLPLIPQIAHAVMAQRLPDVARRVLEAVALVPIDAEPFPPPLVLLRQGRRLSV